HSWSGFAFQKVYKWEYMKYYSLNRGEDGACSMMMPPSATNSSNMAQREKITERADENSPRSCPWM
uniref:Uncharacterized protein n=1 Tax=Aegilops tauschii subsp. strangulata TaxID=200361 RepID=A0A453M4H2_AEGTS